MYKQLTELKFAKGLKVLDRPKTSASVIAEGTDGFSPPSMAPAVTERAASMM